MAIYSFAKCFIQLIKKHIFIVFLKRPTRNQHNNFFLNTVSSKQIESFISKFSKSFCSRTFSYKKHFAPISVSPIRRINVSINFIYKSKCDNLFTKTKKDHFKFWQFVIPFLMNKGAFFH